MSNGTTLQEGLKEHSEKVLRLAQETFPHAITIPLDKTNDAWEWIVAERGKPYLGGSDRFGLRVHNPEATWTYLHGQYRFTSEREAVEFKLTWG